MSDCAKFSLTILIYLSGNTKQASRNDITLNEAVLAVAGLVDNVARVSIVELRLFNLDGFSLGCFAETGLETEKVLAKIGFSPNVVMLCLILFILFKPSTVISSLDLITSVYLLSNDLLEACFALLALYIIGENLGRHSKIPWPFLDSITVLLDTDTISFMSL